MRREQKYAHLTEEERTFIRDMVYWGASANDTAKELGVSHTTVIREVKRNRIVKTPKPRKANPALYCKHYNNCGRKFEVCNKCSSPYTFCKKCRITPCYKYCFHYEPIMCEKTEKWPYVCPSMCEKRKSCRFPKCSYAPTFAQKAYNKRLIESREGINIEYEDLMGIVKFIKPYLKRGYSPYAVIEEFGDMLGITERTFYRYIELGVTDIAAIDLPRKVRYKKRKSKKILAKDKIDRTGRTYSDYLKLSKKDKESVFQLDTVEGLKTNSQRLLTMHNPKSKFQFISLLANGGPTQVVKLFDYYEKLLGSPEKFEKVFGILLADRGHEFDYIAEMERSCLNSSKKRCRVYFCDPQQPNQKGSAEKNHEHIRSVLPKGHSNFDLLTNYWASNLCCVINSYPRKSLNGNTPFSKIKNLVPKSFLDELGLYQYKPSQVDLTPNLLWFTQC